MILLALKPKITALIDRSNNCSLGIEYSISGKFHEIVTLNKLMYKFTSENSDYDLSSLEIRIFTATKHDLVATPI